MSMAAGVAAMRGLTEDVFERLAANGDRLRGGLTKVMGELGLGMRVNGLASMSSIQFFSEPARDYRALHTLSGENYLDRMRNLHRAMLNAGIVMATRGLMIGSAAMTSADIDETLVRAREALLQFSEREAA
jgi:glutamate-1-semialdehyde aminotransferase